MRPGGLAVDVQVPHFLCRQTHPVSTTESRTNSLSRNRTVPIPDANVSLALRWAILLHHRQQTRADTLHRFTSQQRYLGENATRWTRPRRAGATLPVQANPPSLDH